MATLSISTTDGDVVTTLSAAAGEAGFAATPAGFKQMVIAYIRGVYQQQKLLGAQRAVAGTVDTAVTQARTDATAGIS